MNAVASKAIGEVTGATGGDFLEEVCAIPGGESIRWCIQCGMCSASCPNAAQMDNTLRKTIALIRAGRRQDVLASNTMWVCASCYLCTVRCPKEVKITELMHTLERLASYYGLTTKRTTTADMYQVFIDSIKSNGRVHELGMMMRYYTKMVLTGKVNPFSLIGMLPLAMNLMSHGRLVLTPKKTKGVGQVRTIVQKAKALGGAK
jgi:heterodisulfide reductase subunit C